MLYHNYVESNGTLRVIPPISLRQRLFKQAHGGRFGGYLGDANVFSELRRHYWWIGMRSDLGHWTRGCLVCTTRGMGRQTQALLTPIPVNDPFDRIGVDVIQFPRSHGGNQYAVVFMDYLTKWPEVFAVPDQTAATIATLLVEHIVSRHGVPSEVLSDRGKAFLSALLREVELLLGFHKVNTSAYHPQTDGLVERFNCTLTAMLAKTKVGIGTYHLCYSRIEPVNNSLLRNLHFFYSMAETLDCRRMLSCALPKPERMALDWHRKWRMLEN